MRHSLIVTLAAISLSLVTSALAQEQIAAPFALTLAHERLVVHQGSRSSVFVTITRASTFSGDVEVTLADPPKGIRSNTLLFQDGGTESKLTISASLSTSFDKPVVLTVRGASGTLEQFATLNVTVLPEAPSPAQLIRSALDTGQIDYGTSLLYRAYTLFADPRLPEEFWGSGSSEEDNGLFFEVERAIDTLPDDLQRDLRQFIVRPNHPNSVFNQGVPRMGGSSIVDLQATTIQTCRTIVNPTDWISIRSLNFPVRIWARCGGNNDLNTPRDLARVLTLAEKMWVPMTDLMKPLRLDCRDDGLDCHEDRGGDNAIDIYLLNASAFIRRSYFSGGPGATASSPPVDDQKRSGYIMLDRTSVYSDGFYGTLIHEFFHVLQNAHNYDIQQRYLPPGPARIEYWFTEASATWAESHFVRLTGSAAEKQATADEVHGRFLNDFQNEALSLHISAEFGVDVDHMYAAYIWPFFIEQMTGSSRDIGKAWVALENATNWNEAINAINSVFPFSTYFRDFTLRNLNSTQQLFDGQNPLGRRYVYLDPDFPDDHPPEVGVSKRIDLEFFPGLWAQNQPPYVINTKIQSLASVYYHFVAAGDVGHWEFDFSGLQPPGTLTIDAVVKTKKGEWKVRPLSPTSKFLPCHVEKLYLVLGNHALEDVSVDIDKGAIQGSFTVSPRSDECGNWSGTFSHTTHRTSRTLSTTEHFSGEVAWASPVMTGGGTQYSILHGSAKFTIQRWDSLSLCFWRGEKEFSMPGFNAVSNLYVRSNDQYQALVSAHGLVTVEKRCPPKPPLGGGKSSTTTSYSPAWHTITMSNAWPVINGDRMQGSYRKSLPTGLNDYEAFTWDFAPAY
jgi:hypothetical protein